jgi:hypothetical protein
MGLSIHFSGTIKHPSQIPSLVAEVTDICDSKQWKYQVIDLPDADALRGIVVSPEGSESIFLSFLPNGQLCSPINLMMRETYEQHNLGEKSMRTISCKTQYAGIDTHRAIIKLFRYLNEKYFSAFEMMDESYYWETNDEKKLEERFGFIGANSS